jgi:hypothetical protein
MPFIPDQHSSGFVPDNAPGFIPDTPKPSLAQRAKNAAVSFFSGGPEAAMLRASNKIDTKIKQVRSETIPNLIPQSVANKKTPIPTPGTVVRAAGSYLTSGATNINPEFQTVKDVARNASELAIPTTKETVGGLLGGALVKGAVKPASALLEKLSPKFAASQTVKREVESLGRIAANKLPGEMGPIRDFVPGEPIQTSKNYLNAIKTKDGKILYDRTSVSHADMANRLVEKQPDIFSNVEETGFVTPRGKYIPGSISGKVAQKQTQFFKDTGRHANQSEIDNLVKEVVGDLKPKEDAPILARSRPSALKAIVDRVLPEETALRRQGKTGGVLADSALAAEEDAQVMAGKAKEKILPSILKLSPEDKTKFADYIEPRFGQKAPELTGEAKQVADKTKSYLKAWGKFLEKQNIEVMTKDGPRPFYAKNSFFPRSPDLAKLKTTEGYSSEIEHLVETGQAKDATEAKGVVDTILQRRSNILQPGDFNGFSGVKKLGTIERPRVYNLLNVENDPVKGLTNYFDGVSRRINQIRYFGQHDEKLHEMLSAVSHEGGDAEFANEIMDRYMGKDKKAFSGNYAVREIKAAEAITKLGLSPIANVQQGIVNSTIRANEKSLVKGFPKALTKEGVSFARRAGVIDNEAVDKYLEDLGALSKDDMTGPISKVADKFLTANQFKRTEGWNRIQAANIGREYILDLADKVVKNPKNAFARKELAAFRIDPDQLVSRGKVTDNELLRAANRFVGETQFGSRPLAMPSIYRSSNAGKLMGQFSGFIVPQGRLTINAIKRKPLQTAYRIPALATAVGGPLMVGARLATGRDAFTPEEKKNPLNFAKNALKQGGFLGKAGSVLEATKFGVQGPLKALLGPAGADVAQGMYAARSGNFRKFLLKQVPIVGPAASERIFPAKRKK